MIFNGFSCLQESKIPEYRVVYFDFDCPSDIFCLIKPAFAVTVDFINGEIIKIIDPYILENNDNELTVYLLDTDKDTASDITSDNQKISAILSRLEEGDFDIQKKLKDRMVVLGGSKLKDRRLLGGSKLKDR